MTGSQRGASKKRGRPAGASSAETRARLIDSARRIFAEQGFDRATLGDIARGADIVGSAVYRHFPDKESLYEAVFDATISHLWELLDASTRGHDSAASALEALVLAADSARKELPFYPEYLRAVPLEAVRHRRLQVLVRRRDQIQRATFSSIAALGRGSGEFDDVLPLAELSEHLRVIVMGWLVERNLFDDSPLDTRGLLHLLGLRSASA